MKENYNKSVFIIIRREYIRYNLLLLEKTKGNKEEIFIIIR